MRTAQLLQKQNLFWLALIIGHLTVLTALHSSVGFNTLNEGDKYLTSAEELIKGNFQKAFGYKILYSSYIIYLAIFKLLKLPTISIFLCNYALSLIAYYLFYQFINKKIGNSQAKIWLALMLLSPLIQFWQFNLFSETFFITTNLIFIYVLFYSNVKRRLLKICLLSVIIVFARPSGIFSVIIFLSLYGLVNDLISKRKLIPFLFILASTLFFGILFSVPLHYRGYCKDITMGSIYCGFPLFSNPILPKADYTLWQCYHYLYQEHGLGTIIKLIFKKIDSFFVLSRPYYTNLHNAINLFHYVFYLLGLYGLFLSLKHKNFETNILKTILIVVLLNALLIGLFFNEWSERYTIAVFPFVFLAASSGILNLYKTLRSKFAI